MPLSPGTRLGAYEVISSLGAGGMGEVYRARDTQLNRDIALKILPETFAADADRVARFKREAQVLAALNHPNIAQIYGIEANAIVMELVDGPDLSEVIAEHGRSAPAASMRIDDALVIARQIVDALEAAHELGIVHRDLKPANIKIKGAWGPTPTRLPDGRLAPPRSASDIADGTVKVLDFGLAKAMVPDSSAAANSANSPTLTTPAMTMMGVILGTAAYMSPEQAKGRVVDKRSDIWAFGVVLYEMLAGQPLFAGDSVVETLGFVATRDPDWTKLPATTPASVRRLLARCLTRDPKQRLRDIGEARVALADSGDGDALAPLPAPGPQAARQRLWIPATLLTFGVLAGSIATWLLFRPPSAAAELPSAHLGIALTHSMQLGLPQPSIALSPDGTRLVYTSGVTNAPPGLWVRPLDQMESTFLAGSSGRNAFFSPDGKWIGSTASGSIVKMPVGAGAQTVVCATPTAAWGATWTSRDEIVFAVQDDGLYRVAASGGTPKRIAAGRFWYPDALPDGHHVVVTADNPAAQVSDDYRIALVDLETGTVTTLFDGGTYVRYAASGHLVYLRARSLMAVAFDPEARVVHGSPVAVVQDVYVNQALPGGNFAVSPAGTLVYVPASTRTDADRSLIAVSGDGSSRPISDLRRPFSGFVQASADGARLLVNTVAIRNKAWVLDVARGVLTGVTPDEYDVGHAIWTPDEQQIAFGASIGGKPQNLFLLDAQPRNGRRARGGLGVAAVPERLTTSSRRQEPVAWTPDGKTLVFSEYTDTKGIDLWTLSLDGDRTPQPLVQTHGRTRGAAISPDGRRIAYESTAETGFNAVYVADFPSMARPERVSDAQSRNPLWSRDNRRLYFHQGAGDSAAVMVVDVPLAATLRVSKPQHVVTLPWAAQSFDLLPDGRFVMVDGTRAPGATEQLNIVLNWFSELRNKVPGR